MHTIFRHALMFAIRVALARNLISRPSLQDCTSATVVVLSRQAIFRKPGRRSEHQPFFHWSLRCLLVAAPAAVRCFSPVGTWARAGKAPSGFARLTSRPASCSTMASPRAGPRWTRRIRHGSLQLPPNRFLAVEMGYADLGKSEL
jgi:hypothetical protein